ncbi:hypothetical protein MNBD_GAMMA09-1450 [hydrothermal vent metagenome]|uniref:Cadherin-like beta-sandwich-like domain-containing protein n=1 Tax=hydrothermal vent metagenome TaxID=652676 RepID=A0A3B0XFC5_9ZZZZ
MKKQYSLHIIKTLLVFSLFLLSACGSGSGSGGGDTALSSNADLNSLTVSTGTLNTAFDSSITSYTLDGVVAATITLTPVSSDANASITVNGVSVSSGSSSTPVALSLGANTITVVVTAEDASTTKSYNFTVNRVTASSNNADLSSIILSAGTLDPVFDKDVLAYTANVSNATSTATVTAALFDNAASFTVGGNAEVSGVASTAINLGVGANQIDIVVLAGDGVTTKTYTVTVIRAALTGSNVDLSALSVSLGVLDQAFQSGITTYSMNVNFLITSVRVTAAVSANEIITVNNVLLNSGQESQSLALLEGSNLINVKVTSADGLSAKTYTITANRDTANIFAQQAYIKTTNPFMQNITSAFGGAVGTPALSKGISIDGDTLVIGVPNEYLTPAQELLGGVYVFQRTAGVWVQQARLSSDIDNDFFGANVDLSGDTLVVGALSDNSNAVGINQPRGTTQVAGNSGAVYVFTRTNGVWSQEAFIKASNTDAGDMFGSSISVSGNTLVVGAVFESSAATTINGDQNDNSAFSPGAAYVFVRSASGWSQQAYIKASNAAGFDGFGTSTALYNDTLVIGAPGKGSGVAYVYTRTNTSWSEQAFITSDGANPSSFGKALALFEDTLAIASPDNERSVYIYTGSGANWVKQGEVKGDTLSDDNFGISVDLYRDSLVVGAMDDGSGATGVNGNKPVTGKPTSGAVYVFARNMNSWSEQAYVKATNPDTSDRFGHTVAISEDTMAVTASGERGNAIGVGLNEDGDVGAHSGAVYLFQ